MSYFGIVFAAGFLLGTIRQLWIVPQLGPMLAELLEMPLMLGVIVVAARQVVAGFALIEHAGARIAVGGIGFALLVAAELSAVLAIRGQALDAYVATREPVSGIVYLMMLGVYAIMPRLVPTAPR